MKRLEKFKAYTSDEGSWEIYLFALTPTWYAIKYGKDDYVDTYPSNEAIKSLVEKAERADFSEPGFNNIGKYIIKELFDGKIKTHIKELSR